MTYGKMHRFFLRTVASQGVLSIGDAQMVLERFTDQEQLSVTDLVRAINDEIRPYYQEIKITKDEVTNEDIIVFLSLADNAATKAQNIFTSTELEYFRLLIEHIMSTESRQITRINAMNLVGSMKSSFTKTDAEKVLNTWCRMRYFDKEQENYALGVRAIHEFEAYFRQNMAHAVEDCFLCKHIVYRGYNCPGCAEAIHTRCLKRYLEKVQKWPCCKLDFVQEQLDRLNNEGSRLQQTQHSDTTQPQHLDTTQQSEENNTLLEPTQVSENSEMMDESHETIPDISQRPSRKRKWQISPQTQAPTTSHSTSDDAVAEPAQVLTIRRSTDDIIVEEPTQVQSTRRSIRNSAVAEPTKVLTTRRSAKSTVVEEPEQAPTTHCPAKDTIVEKPTQVRTTRRGIKNSTVAEPEGAPTTRRPEKDIIVEEPTQVRTTRRVVKNSTVAEPEGAPTTRRPEKDIIVEEPTQVRTTRRVVKNSTVAETTQVTSRRSKKDSIVEDTTKVPSARRTRNSTVPEPVTQVQESFENLDVTDEVKTDVSQRVTRKRK